MQQIPTGRQSSFDHPRDGTTTWVLDTNVVLDLFVFQDPRCAGLAAALFAAPGGWVATPAMHAEFSAVIARAELAPWASRHEPAEARWAELTTLFDAAPRCELQCADPNDQMFLDLAVWLRPCWLLSRDAEVLRLSRRAAVLGIRITTPIGWDAEMRRGDPVDRPAM